MAVIIYNIMLEHVYKIVWLCRCFGFVNFYNEVEAERAATAKQGFKVSGVSIKTKGPRQLSVEGHFTKSPPKPEGILANSSHNYRPLTDCAYFVSGKKCTKGGNVSCIVESCVCV